MNKRTVVQTADGRPCIVSMQQKNILTFVQQHPGAMYNEVADHIGFDIPSVNTYASRLEKADLLTREHIRIDGRIRVMLKINSGVQLEFDVVTV